MKLFKTSKNDGLSQDIFGRAKRAGKSLILGFQEKTLLLTQSYSRLSCAADRAFILDGPNYSIDRFSLLSCQN